jgi:Zn-dependent membrane protease YugP
MYFVLVILLMIVGGIVQWRLRSKFAKYSRIPLASGMSGAEVARQMLRDYGIYDVEVISVPGQLTDHYNPIDKTVNLSEDVYYGRSAAVAAHECGHAVQHAEAYSMLQLRSALVPIQNVSATILNVIMWVSFLGGYVFFRLIPIETVLLIIIAAYGVMTLFSFVTLPVEIDASRRAIRWIESRGVVTSAEAPMARDALQWAAYTYVVAALSALTMLLYYVLQFMTASSDD